MQEVEHLQAVSNLSAVGSVKSQDAQALPDMTLQGPLASAPEELHPLLQGSMGELLRDAEVEGAGGLGEGHVAKMGELVQKGRITAPQIPTDTASLGCLRLKSRLADAQKKLSESVAGGRKKVEGHEVHVWRGRGPVCVHRCALLSWL